MPHMKHNGFNNRHEVLPEEQVHHNGHNIEQYLEEHDPSKTECCVPTVCTIGQPIHMTNLTEAVKVVCNNDHCRQGRYMHKKCFEEWEETVLTYLRSTGRARSWSEKQRLQNLWTKKGYDLAYKVSLRFFILNISPHNWQLLSVISDHSLLLEHFECFEFSPKFLLLTA